MCIGCKLINGDIVNVCVLLCVRFVGEVGWFFCLAGGSRLMFMFLRSKDERGVRGCGGFLIAGSNSNVSFLDISGSVGNVS